MTDENALKTYFQFHILCICGGSILFSFVSNSLTYITIPKKQRKIKFKPRIKLNHKIYIDRFQRGHDPFTNQHISEKGKKRSIGSFKQNFL